MSEKEQKLMSTCQQMSTSLYGIEWIVYIYTSKYRGRMQKIEMDILLHL